MWMSTLVGAVGEGRESGQPRSVPQGRIQNLFAGAEGGLAATFQDSCEMGLVDKLPTGLN